MRKSLILFTMLMAMIFLHVQCNSPEPKTLVAAESTFNGFESEVEWGRHLVTVSACHDCHSPKKMTAEGLVIDSSRMLAGHMAGSPEPDVKKRNCNKKDWWLQMILPRGWDPGERPIQLTLPPMQQVSATGPKPSLYWL
jgi:hypothetical protein